MKSTKISAGSYVLSNDHGQKATLNLRDGRWILSFKETTKSFSSKTEAKNYAEKLFGKTDNSSSQEEVIFILSEKEIIEEQNIRFDAIHAMARMTLNWKKDSQRKSCYEAQAFYGHVFRVTKNLDSFGWSAVHLKETERQEADDSWSNNWAIRVIKEREIVSQKVFPSMKEAKAQCSQWARDTKITVDNLITGDSVEISIDTPFSCNPSTETYWSM